MIFFIHSLHNFAALAEICSYLIDFKRFKRSHKHCTVVYRFVILLFLFLNFFSATD